MTRLEIEAGLRTLGWFKYRDVWSKRVPDEAEKGARWRRLFRQVSLREAAAWEGLESCESLS